MKSYHQRLRDEGYLVAGMMGKVGLEESLMKLSLEIAKEVFNSVRIVPAEVALEGENFKPEGENHLVYAKYNPNNPKIKSLIEKYEIGPIANLMHLTDSQGTYFLLNEGYQETILNLASKKK